MKRIPSQEVLLRERPYMDIESSLLNNIKFGLIGLIGDIKIESRGLSGEIQIIAYHEEIKAIDWELIQRN
jgi:hypothetical protein